jgi:hypothetical protein
MLDERSLAMLKVINGECVGTAYKIFSLEDLVLSMPHSYFVDKDGVVKLIQNLCERECVSVKYQDENEVCLCATPKGRTVFENAVNLEIQTRRTEKKYFLYAFLGGCLGSIICAIVCATLLLLGR